MNYNISAYGIYLFLMIIIIVFVGKAFHRNGRIFILSLFRHNAALADTFNNVLLVAYYLFNIGYAFVKLSYWQKVTSPETLVASLSANMGLLIFILAITHYFNMLVIYLLSKSKSSLIINKTFQS